MVRRDFLKALIGSIAALATGSVIKPSVDERPQPYPVSFAQGGSSPYELPPRRVHENRTGQFQWVSFNFHRDDETTAWIPMWPGQRLEIFDDRLGYTILEDDGAWRTISA